jgi:hypothetical protein
MEEPPETPPRFKEPEIVATEAVPTNPPTLVTPSIFPRFVELDISIELAIPAKPPMSRLSDRAVVLTDMEFVECTMVALSETDPKNPPDVPCAELVPKVVVFETEADSTAPTRPPEWIAPETVAVTATFEITRVPDDRAASAPVEYSGFPDSLTGGLNPKKMPEIARFFMLALVSQAKSPADATPDAVAKLGSAEALRFVIECPWPSSVPPNSFTEPSAM